MLYQRPYTVCLSAGMLCGECFPVLATGRAHGSEVNCGGTLSTLPTGEERNENQTPLCLETNWSRSINEAHGSLFFMVASWPMRSDERWQHYAQSCCIYTTQELSMLRERECKHQARQGTATSSSSSYTIAGMDGASLPPVSSPSSTEAWVCPLDPRASHHPPIGTLSTERS